MKTPRELLLYEHRQAQPQLDAIRRVVVDRECRKRPSTSVLPKIGRTAARLWTELILPYPRAWVGVAAVWVLIAGLHITQQRATDPAAETATLAVSNVEFLLEEQALLRAELLGMTEAMPEGESAEDERRWDGPRSQRLGPIRYAGSRGRIRVCTSEDSRGSDFCDPHLNRKQATYET